MANPAGESNAEFLRLDFDRRLMLQFRGSVSPPNPLACLQASNYAEVVVRRQEADMTIWPT